MKTFSTSGTGSGQTLSEIESDKIPIYDSKEDVEADLANLTVGQIVATKDTGDELSHPVDVVEEGNLHAVSSNAVAESLSYSTTEQKTGGIWIDGKPIYKKVFYSDTNFDGSTTVGTITNLGKVIDIRGFIQAVNYGQYPCYTDSGNVWQIYVNSSGTINRTLSGGAFTNSRNPAYVIVEYTKTTD